MSTLSAVAYIESGRAFDTLKNLVRLSCQQHSILTPVLPLEHENKSYRLLLPPAEEACPDGDALQAFEWASNPPDMVVHKARIVADKHICLLTASSLCQLPGSIRLKRRGCSVKNWRLSISTSNSLQAPQLVPIALPANAAALAFLADAIAEHNRSIQSNQADTPEAPVRLTPWLASSLAPIGAAVAIQACWRGWVSRQQIGPLGPQLLHRRAAVCIQRAWRSYLFRQRITMLHAVSLQAKALAMMQPTDCVCLLHQYYLEVFRLQQQGRQGSARPRCFPEHNIRFAFEEGGMIFGVNRPGVDRSGIPFWTGVSLPVVDEEDMEPLGAAELFDAAQCAQLLTHTTTVKKTHRPPTRGGGQGADWVVLGLDPACPEPDTELQMRAAVLLVLTWDIKAQSGIRLWPRPASFFFSSQGSAVQDSRRHIPIPAPLGPDQQARKDELDGVEDALAGGTSPLPTSVHWYPRPERFAVRLSQLRKLGILPHSHTSQSSQVPDPTCSDPLADPSRHFAGLDQEHSQGASSASGPSPPWPTPAQLKQTLAAFGRAEAEETAHMLASREAFDALVKKMHVASLQRQAPQSSPKSASTGHAFLPATSLTMSTANAAAMTEQLRQAQQAVNQEIAGSARQKHQEAAEASKHALKASLYWKGAIGRAHSNLTKSALKQVHQSQRETKQSLVQMGHGRQAKGKQQKHDRQLMGNYHGQLNMLKAFIQHTDMQHREKLEAEASTAAVLQQREEEAQRQAQIVQHLQEAQRAKHVGSEGVRGVPALASRKRAATLRQLQDLVDTRRNEEIDSLEKTAPSGGVWGSQQQPPWWTVLPLTMVGSMSDPQVTSLITTVNDSAFWAGNGNLGQAEPAERHQHALNGHASRQKGSGFQFAGLAKPMGLGT